MPRKKAEKTLKERLQPLKKEILQLMEDYDRQQEEEAEKYKRQLETKAKADAAKIFHSMPGRVKEALAKGEDTIDLCEANDDCWNHLNKLLADAGMSTAVQTVTRKEDDPNSDRNRYYDNYVNVEYKVLNFRKLKE
jgi:hypothetical protein